MESPSLPNFFKDKYSRDSLNISFFEEKPNMDQLDFKIPLLENLKNYNLDEITNLLFYGPKSSGKTTKIYAFLASLFNKSVYDLKNITYEDDKKILNYKSSIYHVEINASNLGSNEKLFIQSFLRYYVETRNIGLDIPKIILIKNANLLSKQSQLSLRRIIEKNFNTAKFIFEINDISNFSEPLLSRFLLIRVPLPKLDDIKLCLINFSKRQNINISENEITDIVNESNKINTSIDLKKIFGFYRYYIVTNKKFKFIYYDKFYEILEYIYSKKISFVTLLKIRDLVNEMYISLVPLNELIFFLFNNLLKKYSTNDKFIEDLLKITISSDIYLKKGNKECIHAEHYIVSIINLLQNSINVL
jgi:DNA polymerase III delta prime subunit